MKYKYLLIIFTLFVFTACSLQHSKKEVHKNSFVIITPYGEMKGYLYDNTPLHRDNFIKLVNDGFYDSLLFHRVINNFMIQGGDPDSKNAKKGQALGNGGPGYTIPAEFIKNNIHKKGALAAAREGDNVNPKKASSGSQFYIVQGVVYDSLKLATIDKQFAQQNQNKKVMAFIQLPENKALVYKFDSLQKANNKSALSVLWSKTIKDAKEYYKEDWPQGFTDLQKKIYTTLGGSFHLDGEYTVFGEIYEGLDILDSIAKMKVDRGNRPIKDIPFTIKMLK